MKDQTTIRSDQPRAWTPDAPHRWLENSIAKAGPTSCRRVLRAYAGWLSETRRLAASTIVRNVTVVRTVLQDWLGEETACVARLRRLERCDVEDAFVRGRRREKHGGPLQTAMRSFLQFSAGRGWVSEELVAAVPPLRSYRLSSVPRGVVDEELPQIFAALRPEWPTAVRDRAILLLLATYGARRGQVSALRLVDLDWQGKWVTFRASKRGRSVRHVMTPAVGDALSRYLQERPREGAEHVFLRAKRPYLRLGPVAIGDAMRRLLKDAGVKSRPHGPHAFRHAFARRLLAARQPLETIADLLGHRSLRSTAVYAKVDLPLLREAPLEWPEVLQ